MEEKAKRSRMANYTYDEKNVLFTIVQSYKHIVESKATDATGCQEKYRAWEQIAIKFNAQSPNGVFRPVASLKKCYENEKKVVRKTAAEEKKQFYLTGGGRKKSPPGNPNSDLILSVINEKTIDGLVNPWDSDVIPQESTEEVIYLNVTEEEEEHQEWDEYVPKDLKRKISKPLQYKPSECATNRVVSTVKSFCNQEASTSCQDFDTNIQTSDSTEHGLLVTSTPKKIFNVDTLPSSSNNTSKLLKKSTLGGGVTQLSRRRPHVTALTSSIIAAKYEELLEKRVRIADLECARLQNLRKFEEEEQKLKLEILQAQLLKAKKE